MNTTTRRRVVAGAFAGLLGLTAAACGDDGDDEGAGVPAETQAGDTDAQDTDAATDDTDDTGTDTTQGVGAGTSASDGTGDGIVQGEALPPLPDSGDDPALSQPAPALSGTDYDGEPSTFTPDEDGPTLVTFLAHWCPHCNAEVPVMREWNESGELPDDLNVIGVSTAADPDGDNYPPDEWLEELEWPWQVIADTPEAEAFISYGEGGFPMMVLVDENGEVVDRDTGEKSIEELNEFVEPVAG